MARQCSHPEQREWRIPRRSRQVPYSRRIGSTLSGLAMRVDAMEKTQRSLVNTALNIRNTIKAWDVELTTMSVSIPSFFAKRSPHVDHVAKKDRQTQAFLDLQNRFGVQLDPTNPETPHVPEPESESIPLSNTESESEAESGRYRRQLSALTNRARLIGGLNIPRSGLGSWAPAIRWVVASGLFGLVVLGFRRWLRRPRSRSKLL